jgi:hypothetical protein
MPLGHLEARHDFGKKWLEKNVILTRFFNEKYFFNFYL